jgi:hypothetical protein
MGYYSEVYIAVPKKDEAELDAIMNKHDLLESDFEITGLDVYQSESEYGDNRFEKSNHREFVIYEASRLKWYEQFKDVQEINSFIEMGEEDGRIMVCVGEDSEVHSHIGDYWDVFKVYTKVEVRWRTYTTS